MEVSFILSGIAGQGVQKTGALIAAAASVEGKEATYYPVLSGNKRGGLTSCCVVISDSIIGAPERSRGDYLLLMDEISVQDKMSAFLPGGDVIINSTLAKSTISSEFCHVYEVPMSELALNEIENTKTLSVIAFGFIIALHSVIKKDSAFTVLEKEFGKKKKILELNRKALKLGIDLAKEYVSKGEEN